MYIHEAVKKAMEQGRAIRRVCQNEVGLWDRFAILPTNTRDCCYIIPTVSSDEHGPSIKVGRRWNPLMEDLVADDWEMAN